MKLSVEYKKLVSHILSEGFCNASRNSMQLIVPHYSFTLDFSKDSPELKLRKMNYKGVIGEFKTLVSEEPLTNVSQFEANGCNYWKAWAGPNGELNLDYANMLKPQLPKLIEQIKTDPNSRRHVISLWRHENLDNLSLPCCWHGLTFSVIFDTLHLTWIQRSVDVMVGLPSDIYLAYLFMKLIADEAGLKVGSCMFSLSNVHIYYDHIPNANEILTRDNTDYNRPLKFALMV